MKIVKTICSIVIIVVCCSIILTYLKRQNPVLVALTEVKDHRGSQLLNPFRDKKPELSASAFLDQLKAGNCSAVIDGIERDTKRKVTVCESERQFPIAGWHLEARGSDGQRVLLRYSVTRANGEKRVHDPFWIWLSVQNDNWSVTGYEPWY